MTSVFSKAPMWHEDSSINSCMNCHVYTVSIKLYIIILSEKASHQNPEVGEDVPKVTEEVEDIWE